jgi:uncharacterized protein YdhG (YjbR/CyaY superfamily)
MAGKRPATVAEYIRAAPKEGQPHLRRLHAILAKAAPTADQVIKWGNPFFVEPRYLFSYSACKAHLNFAPSPKTLERFRKDVGKHKTTKYFLQVRYDEELPEALIRKMAEHCVKELRKRKDDAFW